MYKPLLVTKRHPDTAELNVQFRFLKSDFSNNKDITIFTKVNEPV